MPPEQARKFWEWLDPGVPIYIAEAQMAQPDQLLQQLRRRGSR
jgi:hypothetical protein